MFLSPAIEKREMHCIRMDVGLVVVGGGMAGVCAAITAARAGITVALVQDRPVLGGNASSEVRLWVLGATSHMGNNNRWAREGGVIDEILVENIYRNPEGNACILDALLLEKVVSEPNITLLLNTAVFEAIKKSPDVIESVCAFCSQSATMFSIHAPLFCDASGDGVLGFLAGAAFRMGAESAGEFGEKLAPSREYGELLGHSIYFYSKDVGKPVKFVPPSYALKDITKIPRFRQLNAADHGCRLWWLEYGGRLDTVHDTEAIKWELWKVVYGVWDYIKNSGNFPEAESLTLEWVGTIPGKRESRRFEGSYMLRQQDVVEQRYHTDAVAFGGWSLDMHPADGLYSERSGCNQWHSRGVYQIPYRCLYSRNIANLFLAGRIISSSHVAFSSTRVMATCANAAQAVGAAAAIAVQTERFPGEIDVTHLQLELLRTGQHIPGMRLDDPNDFVRNALVSASSRLRLAKLDASGPFLPLTQAVAQMLPVSSGVIPKVTFQVEAAETTTLQLELRTSNRPDNHTPDVVLGFQTVLLTPGQQEVAADLGVSVEEPRYVFFCLMPNEKVAVRCSEQRVSGVLSVANRANPAVARSARQQPIEDIGVEAFEFWTPQRRPDGRNLAIAISPPLDVFSPNNITNGIARPTSTPNAWVADFDDPLPNLTLTWNTPQTISRIELSFDCDFDHPMESVLMGHPERAMPFCVKHYRIRDNCRNMIYECTNNHQTRNSIAIIPSLTTERLIIECLKSNGPTPASIFEVRCYQ